MLLKLVFQESEVGDDVPDGRNIMCEGPETGKSWVFIRNKEKQDGHSPGEGKISQWRSEAPRSCKALRAVGRCLDFMPSPWEALRSGVCRKAVTLAVWGARTGEGHEHKWWGQ